MSSKPAKLGQPLSPREAEVREYLVHGMTARAVGERLNISHRTVEVHRTRIFVKMGVQNAVQLCRAVLTEQQKSAPGATA